MKRLDRDVFSSREDVLERGFLCLLLADLFSSRLAQGLDAPARRKPVSDHLLHRLLGFSRTISRLRMSDGNALLGRGANLIRHGLIAEPLKRTRGLTQEVRDRTLRWLIFLRRDGVRQR